MSREEVCLRPQFKRVLRLYGFDDPNSFLVDSCPESPSTTMQPISVTTHGTVVTEMTPTSQTIQISLNTTTGSASNISTVVTELPAKVTYVGDASFTISNIDTNTNLPMNSQTVTMVVDIETQPHVMPIESTTNQVESTVLTNEQEPKPYNEMEVTDTKPNELVATEKLVASTTPIVIDDPMIQAAATVTQINVDYTSNTKSSQIDKIIDAINNNNETRSSSTETFTTRSRESSSDDDTPNTSSVDAFIAKDDTVLSNNLYVATMKINPDTTIAYTESTMKTTIENELQESNTAMDDKNVQIENSTESIMSTANETVTKKIKTTESMNADNTTEIILSSKSMSNGGDATTTFEMNTIPTITTDQTMPSTKFELNNDISTDYDENLIPTTTTTKVPPTTMSSNNTTENEIIKGAESNQHYQIASLENKSARYLGSNDDLPTFNVEFSVRKEDIQTNCNQTRKRTIIKPDRILTEYPKHSGISIALREPKKRKRRHLEQCNFKNIQYVLLCMPSIKYIYYEKYFFVNIFRSRTQRI